MPQRYRILLITSVVVLILDQWTKWLIDRHLDLHQSLRVIENFFHITYVRNKGASFGMLADSAVRVPLFVTVAVIALAGILWYLHRQADDRPYHHLGLAMIFAGAAGNLIDRLRFGEVIDFIDVHWYQHHWPAFNVADSSITVGTCILLLEMWLFERRQKSS